MALSRARLGLYILGRREIFESCYELREAFELLLKRPDKLALVTGELWPTERLLLDTTSSGGEKDSKEADGEGKGKEVVSITSAVLPGEAIMEGVEHLGQYVYEMTNTRIRQLREERSGGGMLAPDPETILPAEDEVEVVGNEDENGAQGEEEEDPDVGADVEESVRVEGFEAEEE